MFLTWGKRVKCSGAKNSEISYHIISYHIISYLITSATSSILVPPAGDAIKIGPPAALEELGEKVKMKMKVEYNHHDRYKSCSMSTCCIMRGNY